MSALFAVAGRILIGAYFIIAGLIKLLAPAPFEAVFLNAGVAPRWVLPAGFLELIFGLLLALGLLTRLTALVLAAYAVFTLVVFHNQWGDPRQEDTILLHAALVGGLLLVFAHSQIWWSLDALRWRRRDDLTTREAQLRAARAQGALDAEGNPVVAERRWF